MQKKLTDFGVKVNIFEFHSFNSTVDLVIHVCVILPDPGF